MEALMAKRFHETDVWSQDWFMEMPIEYRVFWFWILDKCNHAGIWKPNKKMFELVNALSVDLDEALSFFNAAKERVMVTSKGNWFLTDFFVFQYGTTFNSANRMHNSIQCLMNQDDIKLSSIRGLLEVKERIKTPQLEGNDTLKDKDKDKDIILIVKEGGVGETKDEAFVPTESNGKLVFDVEQEVLSNEIAFEQIVMKSKIEVDTAKERLHVFHLWLLENKKYPYDRSQCFAGFEKWLITGKDFAPKGKFKNNGAGKLQSFPPPPKS
jgi:hypothetical protein